MFAQIQERITRELFKKKKNLEKRKEKSLFIYYIMMYSDTIVATKCTFNASDIYAALSANCGLKSVVQR